MATTKKAPETTDVVEDSALNELFLDELKDIYWAEKHLVKALPKMVKAATSSELKDAIETHIAETEKGSLTRDAGIISAAQKVEHYEIASYGTLRTLALTLGYTEAADLLQATLDEEKNCDSLLTQIAEAGINETAKSEKE